ncbi:hypothetical protein BV898_02394 [Hypsibius exemplaris]|uniref:G-protein coupled receptors family 1 profile domain-containing protein n=1 Tax=Hypsibius exemplaris TaxID=2072580 RepID=A0A1W0X8Q3_HYPEX|nr:hypothetical protein BV898_02394 [Hypsibius exemplaris]
MYMASNLLGYGLNELGSHPTRHGISRLFGGLTFPAQLCHGWGTVAFLCIVAANWTHDVLAGNPFIAAIFPYRYKVFTARRLLTMAVITPWIISVGMNVIPASELTNFRYDPVPHWMGCVPGFISGQELYFDIVRFYLPCLISGVGYVSVLVQSKMALRRRVGDAVKRGAMRKCFKAARMLFACFLWFCVANFGTPTAAQFFPPCLFC